MTSHMSKIIFTTPVGRILLLASNTHVLGLKLLRVDDDTVGELEYSSITQDTIRQFESYFRNAQYKWSLPLAEQGTIFQRKVWQYLQMIPVGETRTYSEVANDISSSARAVGNACRANPYAIVVPCHRVVSKSGFGGYYGKTAGNEIEVKRWLLEYECR